MKGFVDKEACIGCGMCTAICHKVFIMDQDGLAKAKDIDIPDEDMEAAKDAELQCPVEAIKLE
jgi:ferredoxin